MEPFYTSNWEKSGFNHIWRWRKQMEAFYPQFKINMGDAIFREKKSHHLGDAREQIESK